ncbi:putative chitinase 2 [Papilio machaon]|uniref:chitinase n=1 Tax=Papilio machaon TaxID=76193 RepID=A0A0N1I8C1_PAPMA|nr:putative chitinase 2 [Papilio machaon]
MIRKIVLFVIYIWINNNFVFANYTFTYDMALRCKEHICRHGYVYETYYRVDSVDRRHLKIEAELIFEMHLAILAGSNGHILLSTVPQPSTNDPVYEIVIGGGSNRFTELRRNLRRNARASSKTVGILSAIEFRPFYIKIYKDGLIEFGKENEVLPVLSYFDMNPLPVKYFSFAAWNGVEAKFLYDCPAPGSNDTSATPNSEAVERNETSSDSLKTSLLMGRMPNLPPTQQMNVKLGIKVTSLFYNALDAKLTTGLSVFMSWMDDSMAWNPTKFNGTTSLTFRQGQIWSPTFFVFNSDDLGMLDTNNPDHIWMVYSGEAVFHFQTTIYTWCVDYSTNLNRWPRDEYNCSIVIQPWDTYEQIFLSIPKLEEMDGFTDIDDVIQNEWELDIQQNVVSAKTWSNIGAIIGTSTNDSMTTSDKLFIKMNLKRRASSYNIVFYTPLLVVLYTTVLVGALIAIVIHVLLMTEMADRICKKPFMSTILFQRWLRILFCLPEIKLCRIYETLGESNLTAEEDCDSGVGLAPRLELVLCYYGTWATYRPSLGKFDVENIDPNLCTHLVYSFVGINTQGTVISLDPYLDLPDNWGRDNFAKFNALKIGTPNLKTLLAVGGWNEGSAKYSRMVASSILRRNFITSAIKMMQDYGFDGLNLDWEYPNRRDTVNGPADIQNFVQLVKELRTEFDKYGFELSAAVAAVEAVAVQAYDIPGISKKKKRDTVNGPADIQNFVQLVKELRTEFDKYGFELSAAVAAVEAVAVQAYDIPGISKYLDHIGLMTYDLYGPWDPVTGHNSPLHKGEGDGNIPREQLYTVDVALDYWIKNGCPPEKIILGLPLYGHTFTLVNADESGLRAPSSGAGLAGPYTSTNGIIGYNEFCVKLQRETWNVRYDSLAQVPYAVQNRNWVSYDDTGSLTAKVQYGLGKNIGGIMVWSIETDDFRNVCGKGKFPLLNAINKALGINITTTTTTTTTPTVSTTTKAPNTPSESVCKSEGPTADPMDCTSFYICTVDPSGKFIPHKFKCPSNLYWDKNNLYCNYPELVECNVK